MEALRSQILLGLVLVVFKANGAHVGGFITNDAVWTVEQSPYVVTTAVTLSQATLTIEPGVTVRLASGTSIDARSGARLQVNGTEANPVRFLPAQDGTKWNYVSGTGNGTVLNIRHAELAHGGITLSNRATAVVEDSFIRDVQSAITGSGAGLITMRRIHVRNFTETIFHSGSVIFVEDSLFENLVSPSSDALELLGGSGSVIRRCTFRNGSQPNTDAIDLNGATNVLVQDCLIYNFTDKALSFGSTGFDQPPSIGVIVSNTLIHSVAEGLALKDRSEAALYNVTIANANIGLRLYQRYGTPLPGRGGHITSGFDNIIWGNTVNLDLSTNSSMALTCSDIQGTNWPGAGNISSHPQFLNSALHDYRVGSQSPARGTGKFGGDMGAVFPVGAQMALSHPRIESHTRSNGLSVIRFQADAGKSYSLERSTLLGGSWDVVTNVPALSRPALIEAAVPATAGSTFFQLKTP